VGGLAAPSSHTRCLQGSISKRRSHQENVGTQASRGDALLEPDSAVGLRERRPKPAFAAMITDQSLGTTTYEL